MAGYGGPGLLSRLVQGALLVLVAAAALYGAVRLIQEVWVWLVVLAGVAALVWLVSVVIRRQNRYW